MRTDGTLACWGEDDPNGRLDAPPGSYKAVAVGVGHSCALRTDGTIACWGEAGGNPDNGITQVPAGTYKAITARYDYSCALSVAGAITCWGEHAVATRGMPFEGFRLVYPGGGPPPSTIKVLPRSGADVKTITAEGDTGDFFRFAARSSAQASGCSQPKQDPAGRGRIHLADGSRLQGHHRRRGSHLRATRRQHHRMLGIQQRTLPTAVGHLQGHRPHLRTARQRHARMLGNQQLQRRDRHSRWHLQDLRQAPRYYRHQHSGHT